MHESLIAGASVCRESGGYKVQMHYPHIKYTHTIAGPQICSGMQSAYQNKVAFSVYSGICVRELSIFQ